MIVIKISGAGIHKKALEVLEYPIELGFVGSLTAFCDKFPQTTQLTLTQGESDDKK